MVDEYLLKSRDLYREEIKKHKDTAELLFYIFTDISEKASKWTEEDIENNPDGDIAYYWQKEIMADFYPHKNFRIKYCREGKFRKTELVKENIEQVKAESRVIRITTEDEVNMIYTSGSALLLKPRVRVDIEINRNIIEYNNYIPETPYFYYRTLKEIIEKSNSNISIDGLQKTDDEKTREIYTFYVQEA